MTKYLDCMVHGLALGFRTGSVRASLSFCPGGPLSWRTQSPCFKVSVQRILEAFAQGLLVENVHLTNFPVSLYCDIRPKTKMQRQIQTAPLD
jgi:hypothetical protein